jgi:hypothetical protein
VAVNRDGDVLVADNGVGAVMVFESSGKLKKKIGRKGTRRGDFKEMSSLCIGEDGEIIVADTRILIFNAAGEFLRELGGSAAAAGAAKETARGRYSGVALDSKNGLLLAAKMEKTRSYIQVNWTHNPHIEIALLSRSIFIRANAFILFGLPELVFTVLFLKILYWIYEVFIYSRVFTLDFPANIYF